MEPVRRLAEIAAHRLLIAAGLATGAVMLALRQEPVLAFQISAGLLTLLSIALVWVARHENRDRAAAGRHAALAGPARPAGLRRHRYLRQAELVGYTAAAFWTASLIVGRVVGLAVA